MGDTTFLLGAGINPQSMGGMASSHRWLVISSAKFFSSPG
jgi:hypothetical protein